ncbi:MAG: hypothetical protein IKI45_15680 [Oscillospiraceae bacterium]|nr:hypothetical protein [Oscillospiraceae bacterium]
MENTMTHAAITENQKRKILEYLDDARSKHLHMLYLCIAGDVLLFLPGIAIFSGFANRYVTLAGALWFICLIGTAILLLTGWNRVFGSNSAYARMQRNEYSCEYITVSTTSDSAGRPPYLLNDSLGQQYVCPIFVEFKLLHAGSRAIGIYLNDGTRFAVHDTAGDTVY